MNNNYIIKNILPIIYREMNVAEHLDDEIAKKIIIKIVFSYIEKIEDEISYENTRNIIEKLYLKTRSKLNILKPLVDDNEVSEIMVNGPSDIFYEKNNEIIRYHLNFDSDEEIEEVLHSIAGQVNREINELSPILDARLPDGSRVNGVFKNVAVTGPSLTIRKFSKEVISIDQLIENETLTSEAAILLKVFVQCGYNIFISGGTSSGKTTLINALSDYINEGERVIVIEDSTELKLNNVTNLVQMECRNNNSIGKGQITISDLLKNSLRMRPDRIIVGEVRGKEVFHMLQAMNTGHSGMSTGHGNSIEGMLKRLETMYLMAVSIDIHAIRNQIAEGIDIMIHIERKGNKRKIVEISELLTYENDKFVLNKLMIMKDYNRIELTGNRIVNTEKILQKGDKYIDELRGIGINIG